MQYFHSSVVPWFRGSVVLLSLGSVIRPLHGSVTLWFVVQWLGRSMVLWPRGSMVQRPHASTAPFPRPARRSSLEGFHCSRVYSQASSQSQRIRSFTTGSQLCSSKVRFHQATAPRPHCSTVSMPYGSTANRGWQTGSAMIDALSFVPRIAPIFCVERHIPSSKHHQSNERL